ncbi:putative class ii aldolase adducin domain-containing protein [Phaeomoniella chlamydospora]|uniref:Putative class ii aldolase adducin domain-containing protein n=1 Tax=Phaeomoniella chlamydospora TaxID=158046 RepID=A0A0G2GG23_PHACM|nr:putative class ii aldolase adducin domain-containing protein [Phaeomoniella chlamydospora]
MDFNPSQELLSKLITASHILHHHGVCDAYGHISVRNPYRESADTFFMPQNLPPALVTSEEDIVEYNVSDAEPLNRDAPKGYIERNIHAGIYRQYSGVQSVVHAHAESVVAFTIFPEGTLQPVYHMAGFLGTKTPTFDIASVYSEADQQDMLIRTPPLGDAFSCFFSAPPSSKKNPKPDYSVVLMRGHGFTIAAASIEHAVVQANFTKANAEIQSKALAASGGQPLKYLSAHEAHDAWEKANIDTVERPWSLWKAEVEQEGSLYSNSLKNG